MIDAQTLMQQAGMTAYDWMREAREYVEEAFADYPPAARATLIAAYVQAAAGDEVAMYVRVLAEAVVAHTDSVADAAAAAAVRGGQ